jgi:TonB family protein
MHRITLTVVLAAALATLGGHAFAEEPLVSRPVSSFKECGYPEYPASSLRRDEEGVVFLGARIDTSGAVLETKILFSTGTPALDEATEQGLGKCRYQPGKVNGRPAVMWTIVEYFWTLDPSDGKLVARLVKSAQNGDAASRYLLSAFLLPRAKTEAETSNLLKLQISAAEAGNAMAQGAMGGIYEQGKQVAKDMDEARRWFALAAAQGNLFAIDHLRFIDEARSAAAGLRSRAQ